MAKWFFIILLTIALGAAKGHGIRLVVLAVLGLAGLWMLHTLAQDYQNISGGGGGGGKRDASSDGTVQFTKLFSKRSADAVLVDWERVLSRDPASCARSLVCQLEAIGDVALSDEELNIVRLVRKSVDGSSWASGQLERALKNGNEAAGHPAECKKRYRLCPYSSGTMMALLRLFQGQG